MTFRASILTALALGNFLTLQSLAVSNSDPTPDYCYAIQNENPYFKEIENDKKAGIGFAETFSRISDTYHSFIKKTFTDSIKALEKANTKSDTVQCANVSIIPATLNSITILNTTQQELRKYDCALQHLEKHPQLGGSEVSMLQGINTLKNIKDQVEQERIISQKLLISSFQLYEYYYELYPLHSQLLCLIGEIKPFNQALWDFVDNVVIIPSKFYNYGSTHQ